MRLLLDTHAFLWWSEDAPRLRVPAKQAITDADQVLVSVASAWEVAIKTALGKLHLDVPFEKAVEVSRFSKLVIDFPHAEGVAELPPHHKDPFDRMLIVRAQVEGLTIVTHDRAFEPYGVPIVWT